MKKNNYDLRIFNAVLKLDVFAIMFYAVCGDNNGKWSEYG